MPDPAADNPRSTRARPAPSPSALARRTALRLGGSVATVGAAMLAGCSSGGSDAGRARPASQTPADATGPSDSTQVRHFRSRPDLQPARAVVDTDQGPSAGAILLDSHAGVGQQGPMILDSAGELVWFKPLSAHQSARLRAMNLRVQQYRGEPVLTWWEGTVVHAHGQGHYVVANSRYEQIATVSAHNGYRADLHEFVLTEAGTALFTCYGTSRADLRSLGGSATNLYYYGVVQEVDLATGQLVFQWRSDRHVPFSSSYAPMTTLRTAGWDQFHINSINVAPDGNLIVSSRNTWTVYKVHRGTGEIMWRMGGKHSDFTMDSGTRFAWQHHVTPHADGRYTIFDNEAGDYKVGKRSRGLVLHVNEDTRRASLVRQYAPPVPILSSALGSVQQLANGNVFVGWGEQPYFTEYRPDGSIAFSGHLDGAGTFDYRAFKSAWTGQPGGSPVLAASRGGGVTSVAASWNGDTRVRHWKLLAGPSADRLAVVAQVPRRGFETTITTRHATPRLAVAGYDAEGRELGRSAVHAL